MFDFRSRDGAVAWLYLTVHRVPLAETARLLASANSKRRHCRIMSRTGLSLSLGRKETSSVVAEFDGGRSNFQNFYEPITLSSHFNDLELETTWQDRRSAFTICNYAIGPILKYN